MYTASLTQSPPIVELLHILETTTNIKSSTNKLVLEAFSWFNIWQILKLSTSTQRMASNTLLEYMGRDINNDSLLTLVVIQRCVNSWRLA